MYEFQKNCCGRSRRVGQVCTSYCRALSPSAHWRRNRWCKQDLARPLIFYMMNFLWVQFSVDSNYKYNCCGWMESEITTLIVKIYFYQLRVQCIAFLPVPRTFSVQDPVEGKSPELDWMQDLKVLLHTTMVRCYNCMQIMPWYQIPWTRNWLIVLKKY